jgi:hypothetical protein
LCNATSDKVKKVRKIFTRFGLGLLGAALIAAASPAADAAMPLSELELRRAVSGKIIYIATPIGAEVPISYRPNGTMIGRGLTAYAALAGEMATSDRGRWWIANGQLCQRWTRWLDGRTHCFRLTRNGETVHWQRNDGRVGTARIGG